MTAAPRPLLLAELTLPTRWRALGEPAARDAARQACVAALQAVLDDCGLPASADVILHAAPADARRLGPARAPMLRVGSAHWHGAAARQAEVHASVLGQPLAAAHFDTPDWLEDASAVADPRLPAFVGALCETMARRHPSALLTPPVAAAVADALARRGLAIEPARLPRLRVALQRVLAMHLPVDDLDRIAEAWREAEAGRSGDDALAEALIDRLGPAPIALHLSRRTLQAWSTACASDRDLAPSLREAMYFDLGLHTADWTLRPDDTLPDGSFVLQMGTCRSPRLQGLAADQRLLGGLAAGPATAHHALHPLTRQPMRLAALADEPASAALGPLGHALTYLAALLRELAPCALLRQRVAEALRAPTVVGPELARAFLGRHSLEGLTRVLRGLLDEQVSIRHLARIVEALCDVDCIVADGTGLIVFDDRLPVRERPPEGQALEPGLLLAQARRALKRQITAAALAGRSQLPCHLIDPEVERLLAGPRAADADDVSGPLTLAQQQSLLDTLHADLDAPVGEPPPVLLTSAEARPVLRDLLRHAWPHAKVLAFNELRPDISLQPLTRSGLAD
ncbi:FHIPEP family type III secretion protein [Ideonella sp. A 288]|uniref:FHIPEP family type III secretion protein n=1 Tax=Ideonella sp. A 288 TaxID=1962181 RepID=UPI000B4B47B9|nr:FHIPEP family type III secretion protein [Ideonella sp. A 288]